MAAQTETAVVLSRAYRASGVVMTGYHSLTMFSRRTLSVLRSRRDTCICEISSWRAISVWVSPSKKRR